MARGHLLIGLLALLILQGCCASPLGQSKCSAAGELSTTPKAGLSSGGNGEIISGNVGKDPGTFQQFELPEQKFYYSFDANYRCRLSGGTWQASYRSSIVPDQSGMGYVLTGDLCSSSSQTFTAWSATESPLYVPELLGYGESIYQKLDTPWGPGASDDGSVVIWCRTEGASDTSGWDTFITRGDSDVAQVAWTEVSGDKTYARVVEPFPVSVSVASREKRITIDSPFDYVLSIDLRQPVPYRPGRYRGKVDTHIDGRRILHSLQCRVVPSLR